MPLPDVLGPEQAPTRLPVGATVLYLAAADTERVAVVVGEAPDGSCLLSTRRNGTCRVERVRVRNVRLAAAA